MYGIVCEDSYHVPGDERSRTNPGHGYPAHTVKYKTLETFATVEELQKWVKENNVSGRKNSFTAYYLEELSVDTEIVVTVKVTGK